jgi:hypothetical protein
LNEDFTNQLNTSLKTMDYKYTSLYSPSKVLPVIGFIFYQKNEILKSILKKMNVKEEKYFHELQNSLENKIRVILKKGKYSGSEYTKYYIFLKQFLKKI